MSYKFTVYGSTFLESKIMSQMEQIASEVKKIFEKDDLCALILGGGYGKGEGGVIKENGEESTFNDFDFFVITNDINRLKRKEYDLALKKVSERLTDMCGIDVDFAFPINRSDIRNLPFTQMWGELKHGFYTAAGEKNVLDLYLYDDLKELPLSEAVKLLLNRGVGLLLASNRINELKTSGVTQPSREDKDFISRNIFKAVIGIGDALLISRQKFHHSYVTRLSLINECSEISEDFKKIYARAIDFKLRPSLCFNLVELKELLDIVIELFEKPYVEISGKSPKNRNFLKNAAINFREFGLSQTFKWFFLYPRERLVFALPFFLFKDANVRSDDVLTALNMPKDSDKIDMFDQFNIIWRKFN